MVKGLGSLLRRFLMGSTSSTGAGRVRVGKEGGLLGKSPIKALTQKQPASTPAPLCGRGLPAPLPPNHVDAHALVLTPAAVETCVLKRSP